MTKCEKTIAVITMLGALIGAFSGIWGTYTAYDASKFKQPFDEHDQMAKSYTGQITSAEKRQDSKEVTRVRFLYEAYEEKWRAARQIAQIVAPLENLALDQLTAKQRNDLKKLLTKASEGPSQPSLPPKTLGTAYLAIKDFDSAVAQLSLASSKDGDPETLALKAAAFSELASRESDPQVKMYYMTATANSYSTAIKITSDKTKIYGFTMSNPTLKAVLEDEKLHDNKIEFPSEQD